MMNLDYKWKYKCAYIYVNTHKENRHSSLPKQDKRSSETFGSNKE